LRAFTVYSQEDWKALLPVATIAINNRDSSSTGLSPFFFTHGYHVDPIGIEEVDLDNLRATERAGNGFVDRLAEATNWATAAMAAAQERQQDQANRSRQAAPVYKPGDKVWLNLRHIATQRASKKLDWLHAKYEVLEVPSSHTVRLRVPTGVHPVFHVDLVRPAATDPLPSQERDDAQPPPIIVDGEEEYEVEEILGARTQKVGRGTRRMVLVRWRGYSQDTWQPLTDVEDCTALDEYERKYGDIRTHDGPIVRAGALTTLARKTGEALKALTGGVERGGGYVTGQGRCLITCKHATHAHCLSTSRT
jgi:hypothetical protein